jgi:putative ABC transport system permease protein
VSTMRPRATRLTRVPATASSPMPPAPQTPATPPANPEESPLGLLLQQLRVRKQRPGSMIIANFRIAVEALWANRTRSFLTILGIFIGVAAVIAALTLTQGVQAYINGKLASLGNTVIVSPGSSNSRGARGGTGTISSLTPKDAQSLVGLPHITAVSPFIVVSTQIIYGNQNWTTNVEGVYANIESMQDWTVAQGSWFSQADALNGTPVAVLGDTVMHSLFDASGRNPIGQKIRIRDQIFTVVGVLAPKGLGGQDDVVFIPFKSAQLRMKNTPNVDEIQVQLDDSTNANLVAQEITSVLQRNHHIDNPNNDDFTVFTFTQVLQNVGQSTLVLTFLLVGIAGISLTVGGVGIINIMLVSVTERTWEIGIRMSIGARRRDILNQFLIEALVLCLVGGIIGLLVGLLIGAQVTKLSGLPFVITPVTLILPFAVAAGSAVVFGIYPAIRASRLDPVVAIRIDE